MTRQDNFNILPWYSSLDEQRHRGKYAMNRVWPLYALNNIPPVFQATISDELVLARISGELINLQTGAITNINSWIAGLRVVVKTNFGLFINDGVLPIAGATLIGQHYIKLTVTPDDDDAYNLYSEVFTFVDNVSNCIKLEYWDSVDFETPPSVIPPHNTAISHGLIHYDSTFKNRVYLNGIVSRPNYLFEEEATTRDGFVFSEKQISKIQFKFDFIAPEFITSALRIVRMHDYIRITYDGIVYVVDNFLMSAKWLDGSDLASVEVEFEAGTVVKKIGKYAGEPPAVAGDFNTDFNTDFNNL